MAFSVFCFAAESENISVPNKAIGFSYTSGTEEFMNMGITYQQWFDNSLGFSGTIGGAFQKDSEMANHFINAKVINNSCNKQITP